MNTKRTVYLFIVAVTFDSQAAHGIPLSCSQESGTRQMFCYDKKNITENATLRGAAIYIGGPGEGAKNTGLKMIVDCKTKIAIIQNAKTGVNLAGADQSTQPKHLRDLSHFVCDEKAAKKDPKLIMFDK